jgi:hypothetical protein
MRNQSRGYIINIIVSLFFKVCIFSGEGKSVCKTLNTSLVNYLGKTSIAVNILLMSFNLRLVIFVAKLFPGKFKQHVHHVY